MFCTQCGKEVEQQARFCSKCGHELSPVPAVSELGAHARDHHGRSPALPLPDWYRVRDLCVLGFVFPGGTGALPESFRTGECLMLSVDIDVLVLVGTVGTFNIARPANFAYSPA